MDNNSMIEIKQVQGSCPLCGSKELNHLLTGKDRLHGIPGEFPVVQCMECTLAFIHPQPPLENIPSFYPANYYAYAEDRPAEHATLKRLELEFRERKKAEIATVHYGYPRRFPKSFLFSVVAFFFRKVRDLPRYVEDGVLLDIGCGKGTYLQEMQKFGWKTRGVEFDINGVRAARRAGLEVFHGSLEEACFPDNSFDFARMGDVLEHLPQPLQTMRELRRVLKPGGLVRINVPNLKSLTFLLFGKYWFPLEIPRHLFFYSPPSLQLLAEKAGFEMVRLKIRSHKEVDVIPSIQFWLEEKHPNIVDIYSKRGIQKLIRKCIHPFKAIVTALGYGSVMTVTLRNPLV